jgi:hypothetical protein
MLIFWKARLAILAVPKTGTTALELALAPHADAAILNPPGLKHCTVKKYRRELAGFFEQKGKRPLELLAVMREPVSWLGSWYRYRSRPGLSGQANSTAGISFDSFVASYLTDPQPPFARVGSQAQFLDGGVDHLFRHGDTDGLLRFLEGRIGMKIDLEKTNVSPGGDLDLSDEMHSRLKNERIKDFDIWDGIG